MMKSDWRQQLDESITTPEQLAGHMDMDPRPLRAVVKRYPMRITPYYLSLVLAHGNTLYRQVIPSPEELDDKVNMADPSGETPSSPVSRLIHRYPDRVVILATGSCASYCRHCMRKRLVGKNVPGAENPPLDLDPILRYLYDHREINDVILSGGDPLMLGTDDLDAILYPITRIPHVDIVRIHTRIPATLPQRITENLVRTLQSRSPLFVNIQFNHPAELSPEAIAACTRLADAGIPLGSQTVLLKGINDRPDILKSLFKGLLRGRIKPYYLHHPDPVKGTNHFRPSVDEGLKILQALRGHISGMCLPHYMIDLPDGGGKIPILPPYIRNVDDHGLTVINYKGDVHIYPTI